ncbi:hypothetical protein LH23_14260 [Cedecea neteri]|uniref:Uncharacterized protein n=1 Tax=Cedecea neteri TaxID=158822 RepID=A0AAN0S5B0_9ENTR|nr:hypothetical protein [Cedecea neteri]AIR61773.1 hypothetical protein LH23_14260 [Cedecea neteri]
MTNKVNNVPVKEFMENVKKFNDNKEIKDIINQFKDFGLTGSRRGLNPLFMFIVLKEADEINNKEVGRIIEGFRIEQEYKELIKVAASKVEKQYLRNVMKLPNGEWNTALLKSFGSDYKPLDERTHRRYGNAIREASKAGQELIRGMVVEVVEEVVLTRAQKQSIERWFDAGMTEEALLQYLNERKK